MEWMKDYLYDYLGRELKMFDYQKSLTKSIEENRFTHILKSRQIGITTFFCNYIANFLINNTNKVIVFVGNKLMLSRSKCKLIHSIVKHLMGDDFIVKNNVSIMELKNGSKLLIMSNQESICCNQKIVNTI